MRVKEESPPNEGRRSYLKGLGVLVSGIFDRPVRGHTTRNNEYRINSGNAIGRTRDHDRNFQQLDVDVEIRDLESNIFYYEPKDDAKFFATDTESVFIGDKDRWTRVVSSGQAPAFESVQTNRLNDTIHVSAEEDGEGIQEAIDELTPGGGLVELERGTYRLERPLKFSNQIALRGKGRATTLESHVDDDFGIKIEGTADRTSEHVYGCMLEKVQLVPTNRHNRQHGLLLKHSHENKIRDVFLKGFRGEGIRQEGDWESEFIGLRVSDCGSLNEPIWHARAAAGGTQTNHADIIATKLGGDHDLMLLDDCHQMKFTNVKFTLTDDATCVRMQDSGYDANNTTNRMYRFVNCTFFRDGGEVKQGTGFSCDQPEDVGWIGCSFHSLETVFEGYGGNLRGILAANQFRGNANINDLAEWETIHGNTGYRFENQGSVVFDGDGSKKRFTEDPNGNTIQHNLAENPTDRTKLFTNATAQSRAAERAAPVDAVPADLDGDGHYESLRFILASPPPEGQANVSLTWKVELQV